jgi:RNA polymerase sporulation-specific sigma factor
LEDGKAERARKRGAIFSPNMRVVRIMERRPTEAQWDTTDLESVLVAFLPFVRKQAKILSGNDVHLRDDLIQEGLFALCRSAGAFDPNRGAYASFACACARNAMISYLRRTSSSREDLVEETASLEDLDLGEDLLGIAEDREFLGHLLDRLTPVEIAAVDALWACGSVGRAVGTLGWPYKRVENALARVRNKARRLVVERSLSKME